MSYKAPFFFRNGHINTIYSSIFRRIQVAYKRERILTEDNDFIDLDWIRNDSSKLVVLCHGVEGSSSSTYMKGMATIFSKNNYDIVAYNYRGCSGEINQQLKAYHAGSTEDLQTVINHISTVKNYKEIVLIGFSLGGNLVLKYVGKHAASLAENIKYCISISAPIDLEGTNNEIQKLKNYLYRKVFISRLRAKAVLRKKLISESTIAINYQNLMKTKSIIDFDKFFTIPIEGYENMKQFWDENSAIHYLKNIQIPTLLINAKDDSLLSSKCFPSTIENLNFQFVSTKHGGHVGYVLFNKEREYWTEKEALKFVKNYKRDFTRRI